MYKKIFVAGVLALAGLMSVACGGTTATKQVVWALQLT